MDYSSGDKRGCAHFCPICPLLAICCPLAIFPFVPYWPLSCILYMFSLHSRIIIEGVQVEFRVIPSEFSPEIRRNMHWNSVKFCGTPYPRNSVSTEFCWIFHGILYPRNSPELLHGVLYPQNSVLRNSVSAEFRGKGDSAKEGTPCPGIQRNFSRKSAEFLYAGKIPRNSTVCFRRNSWIPYKEFRQNKIRLEFFLTE